MAKNVHDDVLDAALNHLKTNGNKLVVLNAEPTGASAYANAILDAASSGFRLADIVISASDFTGPAEGTTSGRKLTVNAQSSMSIDGVAASTADSATHVAIINTTASSTAVLYTTTCTAQSLTSGNTVNTPAWEIEIRDPA